jgi:hypothetical protein
MKGEKRWGFSCNSCSDGSEREDRGSDLHRSLESQMRVYSPSQPSSPLLNVTPFSSRSRLILNRIICKYQHHLDWTLYPDSSSKSLSRSIPIALSHCFSAGPEFDTDPSDFPP